MAGVWVAVYMWYGRAGRARLLYGTREGYGRLEGHSTGLDGQSGRAVWYNSHGQHDVCRRGNAVNLPATWMGRRLGVSRWKIGAWMVDVRAPR